MKTGNEMAESVFGKIEIYKEEKKRKKKAAVKIVTTAFCIGICGIVAVTAMSRSKMGASKDASSNMELAVEINDAYSEDGAAEYETDSDKGVASTYSSSGIICEANESPEEECSLKVDVSRISDTDEGVDTAVVKSFSEKKLTEKYVECLFGIKTYTYINTNPDVKTKLSKDTLLGAGKCSGFDEYANETKTVNVKVYSLSGINPDLAVGIEFSDVNGLYPYVNCEYKPTTLGQFMKDINFDETVTFSNTTYDVNGNVISKDICKEDIKKYLLVESASYAGDDYGSEYPNIRIGISCKVLGIENMTFFVLNDGRVGTNMLNGCLKLFNVGEDKVEKFKEVAF